jgi:hypothetical protein
MSEQRLPGQLAEAKAEAIKNHTTFSLFAWFFKSSLGGLVAALISTYGESVPSLYVP